MDDRRLDESLRRLPEARAGEGFTAAVMARLDAGDAETAPAASWWAPLPRLAATAAVLLVAVAFGFWIALPSPTAPGGGDTPATAATTAPADAEPATEPVATRVPTRSADDAPATATPTTDDPSPPARRTAPATAQPAVLASDRATDLDREAAGRRLAELRRERERLVSDLATLAAAERPTVVLGGDETVELVLDFAEPGYGVRPAAYRPNDSD
ncbi:MAG TPA: hypothetical protein VKU40_17365 [Thermoanaerobaculia bacterium]|nr:hypothetical protein [Thermoanaerobaculia bacterium]